MSRYSLLLVNVSVGLSHGKEEAVHVRDFTYYCFVKLNEDSKLHLFSNPSSKTGYFMYTKSSNSQGQLEEFLKDEYIIN